MSLEKKIYFISDIHLGLPDPDGGPEKEKLVVKWLNEIQNQCSELFLLGDIFDFWFDYRKVVPRGNVRFLAKIAEFADSGIPVHYFSGNHDLWLFDYFEKELGVTIHRSPLQIERFGKKLYLAHGDGLGPGDKKYKFLKKIFTSKVAQYFFRWLHPDVGVAIARKWSQGSRYSHKVREFLGEKEWLIQHSRSVLGESNVDLFVYGHRHLPVDYALNEHSHYINLGEWIYSTSYLEISAEGYELKHFVKNRSTEK